MYAGFCEFLQERMKLAHIHQAETMVQIGNMRQQSNQSVQNFITTLSELEEQQDPPFFNDQKMTNLFLVLDKNLWNEVVGFEKPHAMCEKLEASAISLEKTLASTETLSQKDNPSLGHTCKS